MTPETNPPLAKLHPIIHAAGAERRHPEWAVMTEARRRHTQRVGRLLWDWGGALGLAEAERIRWRAAGLLHDALKDAPPPILRLEVEDAEAWPPSLLHGPACASRLRAAGVEDAAFLRAVAFHTTGHAGFRALGQALYMADYLEPGRRHAGPERAAWRRRMPSDWRGVLADVATAKIATILRRRIPISAPTADFWWAVTTPDAPPD